MDLIYGEATDRSHEEIQLYRAIYQNSYIFYGLIVCMIVCFLYIVNQAVENDHQAVENDHQAVENDHQAVENDHQAVENDQFVRAPKIIYGERKVLPQTSLLKKFSVDHK